MHAKPHNGSLNSRVTQKRGSKTKKIENKGDILKIHSLLCRYMIIFAKQNKNKTKSLTGL